MPGEPILIYLVHGTWPEGPWRAFTDLVRRCINRERDRSATGKKYWFQNQHPFHTELEKQLSTEGFLPVIAEITWSGANSFSHRTSAAGVLEAALRGMSGKARQVVIGHSHGGSVGLQAISRLEMPDVELVTMATPFLRVEEFASNQGLWSLLTVWWMGAIAVLNSWTAHRYGPSIGSLVLFFAIMAFAVATRLLGNWTKWVRENIVKVCATRYQGPRIQCVRGIADEAGFAVNMGISGSWIGRTFLTLFGNLLGRVPDFVKLAAYVALIAFMVVAALVPRIYPVVLWIGGGLVGVLSIAILASLLQGTLGTELAFAGLGFITSVESAPDAHQHQLEIVTLTTTQDTTDGMRHGVYNHPECVRTIVQGICQYKPAAAFKLEANS